MILCFNMLCPLGDILLLLLRESFFFFERCHRKGHEHWRCQHRDTVAATTALRPPGLYPERYCYFFWCRFPSRCVELTSHPGSCLEPGIAGTVIRVAGRVRGSSLPPPRLRGGPAHTVSCSVAGGHLLWPEIGCEIAAP